VSYLSAARMGQLPCGQPQSRRSVVGLKARIAFIKPAAQLQSVGAALALRPSKLWKAAGESIRVLVRHGSGGDIRAQNCLNDPRRLQEVRCVSHQVALRTVLLVLVPKVYHDVWYRVWGDCIRPIYITGERFSKTPIRQL